MEFEANLNRRDLLLGAGGLVLGMLVPGQAEPLKTPHQTEGPFYPLTIKESDADLTRLVGRKGRAKGEEVLVTGTVRNLDGKPLAGTQIDLWQACASGRYAHPSDPNKAPLDPGFQGFGRVKTNKLGQFRFRTIKPGAYPAAPGWVRPPHLHFKVRCPGYSELTTQMYFEGDKLNAKDGILNSLSAAQQKLVVVGFTPVQSVSTGSFDIILGRPGAYSGIVTPYLD